MAQSFKTTCSPTSGVLQLLQGTRLHSTLAAFPCREIWLLPGHEVHEKSGFAERDSHGISEPCAFSTLGCVLTVEYLWQGRRA